MKNLIVVLVLAVVATAAYAGSAFSSSIFFNGTNWVSGTGPNCQGSLAACKITTTETLDPSAYNQVGNAAPASGTTFEVPNVDHDDDPTTPNITVHATVTARFPIAP